MMQVLQGRLCKSSSYLSKTKCASNEVLSLTVKSTAPWLNMKSVSIAREVRYRILQADRSWKVMDKSAPGTLFLKQQPVLGSLTSCDVSPSCWVGASPAARGL